MWLQRTPSNRVSQYDSVLCWVTQGSFANHSGIPPGGTVPVCKQSQHTRRERSPSSQSKQWNALIACNADSPAGRWHREPKSTNLFAIFRQTWFWAAHNSPCLPQVAQGHALGPPSSSLQVLLRQWLYMRLWQCSEPKISEMAGTEVKCDWVPVANETSPSCSGTESYSSITLSLSKADFFRPWTESWTGLVEDYWMHAWVHT